LALVGSKSNIIYKELPQDDPQQRQPDITLATTQLDWQPSIALDEGLRRTVEYFRAL
jgi:UDP-glucuronate decarboxylase